MRRAQDRARSARSRKNGARSATIESRALGALKLARKARNENVPAKRADFFMQIAVQFDQFLAVAVSIDSFTMFQHLIVHGSLIRSLTQSVSKRRI